MQVGPCIPVGLQLEKAEVGPTSGPTRRLSHLERGRRYMTATYPVAHSTLYGSSLMKTSGLEENDFTARGYLRERGQRLAVLVDDDLAIGGEVNVGQVAEVPAPR